MRVFLALILVCFSAPLVYAQNNQTESLTISTYFPAPYGVYKNLKLQPGPEPTDGAGAGVLYYDQAQDVLKYNNTTAWVNISESGGSGEDWAVITVSCPWGSDYTAGANSGWGNQCNLATNNCCVLPNCPAGWTSAGTGINLTSVSCPRHAVSVNGGCLWNSASENMHPVAVGNIFRKCVKKGATVMTNTTTWWSDHETQQDYNYNGWGDHCFGPTFNRCFTHWDHTTTLPTCPAGWTKIATNATVNQVSCYHNREDSDAGCRWVGIWSTEHPLANGEIVAVCEKN